jgi:disulfide bond formation protein DsbB
MKRMIGIVGILLLLTLGLSAACAPASRAPRAATTPAASNSAATTNNGASQNTSNSAPAQNVSAQGNTSQGQTFFSGSCASCHGKDAKGLPNLGKDLTTSTFVHGESDAALLKFLKTGRPASDPLNTTGVDMPPKGGNPALTDTNLQDIIAYIRSVNK